MTCWNCQKETEPGPWCGQCNAVQPLPAQADYFVILGLPASYMIDEQAVERRCKDLNKQLHPDRFAMKSPRERRFSLEWTTAVNDAWRTLKNPLNRAAYLLKQHEIDLEKNSSERLSPEFLEEVMEYRQVVADARAERDLKKCDRLLGMLNGRYAEHAQQLRLIFERFENHTANNQLRNAAGTEKSRDPSSERQLLLQEAARILAMLKYFARVQQEVEALEQEVLES